MSVTLDWEPKFTAVQGPFRYILGFTEGQWKIARLQLTSNTLSPFLDGTTEKLVAAGISASAGFASTEVVMLADIPTNELESQLYISQDGGETWQTDV